MRRVLGFFLLASAVVAAAGASADEVTFPNRHAGLWEQSLASGDNVRMTRICIDAASDHKLLEYGFARMRQMGGRVNVTGSGSHFHVETVLTVSGHTVTTNLELQYKGDKLIESAGQSRIDPPLEGTPSVVDIKEESRWTGACPKDMQPGDVEVDGQRHNVLKETAGGK
jgi:hypothetical protein